MMRRIDDEDDDDDEHEHEHEDEHDEHEDDSSCLTANDRTTGSDLRSSTPSSPQRSPRSQPTTPERSKLLRCERSDARCGSCC